MDFADIFKRVAYFVFRSYSPIARCNGERV